VITYTYRAGDPPATCPHCGSRTDFEGYQKNRYSPVVQHHTCRNSACGFEFLMEEDNERF